MERLRLLLEYRCFPVWIYSEDGEIIDNGLPEQFSKNTKLESLCSMIQEEFDSHYTNDGIVFQYNNFSNTSEIEQFSKKVEEMEKILREECRGNYEVINDIDFEGL